MVWGSGELAFTGEAGNGPLNLEAQWQRGLAQVDGKGPLATDLMRLVTGAQGSMGIVVWASIKLELIPAVRSSFFVPNAELSGLVDFIYKLTKVRLGDETLLLNRAKLAGLVEPQPAAARKLREALPEWVALVGLAGLVQEFRLTLCGGFAGVSRADVVRLIDGDAGDHPPTLAAKGAKVQRPLWASTSTKNPAYPDLAYVDTLIGPDTVNTMPDATVADFLDHGTVARTVDSDEVGSRAVIDRLADAGIDMEDVAATLETEGVASFAASFDDLMGSLTDKAAALAGT